MGERVFRFEILTIPLSCEVRSLQDCCQFLVCDSFFSRREMLWAFPRQDDKDLTCNRHVEEEEEEKIKEEEV